MKSIAIRINGWKDDYLYEITGLHVTDKRLTKHC